MRKILTYLKSYKKECVLAPLFKLLEATFELFVPLVVAAIVDTGIARGDTGYILRMCGIMILLGVIGLACSVTAQYFAARAAVGFSTKLRHELFAHIQGLSFTELDQAGTSTMITRMTNDVNQVQSGVNLVLRLFNVQDAPQDPKNGDILYVYFSDEYVKRYGQANQLWAEIKKNFHLDILAYVPQKIRHKELRGDRTYVVWKNRIVTLSDIDIRSGSAPGEQYFYLYYQMSEEGEELDVCAFMDFLRERLIQLESGKPSSNDYANTTPVAKETSPKPGETAGDHKTEDHL